MDMETSALVLSWELNSLLRFSCGNLKDDDKMFADRASVPRHATTLAELILRGNRVLLRNKCKRSSSKSRYHKNAILHLAKKPGSGKQCGSIACRSLQASRCLRVGINKSPTEYLISQRSLQNQSRPVCQ